VEQPAKPPADVSDRLNKPSAMAASVPTITKAFNHLKIEFNIGKEFSFNTAEIAVNADEFSNPRSVAAITMRKMQLYVHLAHPDTVTRTRHVMTLAGEMRDALIQLDRHCASDASEAISAAQRSIDEVLNQLIELTSMHKDFRHSTNIELGPTLFPDTAENVQ
jgi:hypothetical protein